MSRLRPASLGRSRNAGPSPTVAFLAAALAGLLALTLSPPILPPAYADSPVLSLVAPATAPMHGPLTLTATVVGETPAVGRPVTLEQQTTGGWEAVATGITDDEGRATFTIRFTTTAVYRATTGAGEDAATSPAATVTGTPRQTRIDVSGTWWVIDERSRILTARWSSDLGEPITGARLTVRTRAAGGTWVVAARPVTDSTGVASFRLAPRADVRVVVDGSAGPWWAAAGSVEHVLDNRPPAPPVAYPRVAPRPRRLPAQGRAIGAGANPVVSRIPSAVWASMRGRTWHPGCPVGRAALRLIRINYWDFTGYRRRGELVVNVAIAARAAGALTAMYRAKLPLRSLYRVDRFGWSARQQGGNDEASMAADNSSGFNCRSVTGWPGRLSPHATGRAIDLNPYENPFVSRAGVLPDRWWLSRSDPRIAWRSAAHPVVRIWRRFGFRWSYPRSDPQHWDGRTPPPPVTATFTG